MIPVITVRSKMSFPDWISQELESRRWRQTDLAQAMSMSDSALSLVLKGERKPGPDFCNGIARAFGIPPEEVFRKAGLLPELPGPEDDELARQLVENFKRLPIEKRREILSYVVWKVQESRLEDIQGLDDNGPGQAS